MLIMITDQVQNKILKIKKTKGLCTHRSYKKYIPVVLTILTMYGLFYLCVCVDVHLCVCYLFTLVWMCAHEYKGKCACICKLWHSPFSAYLLPWGYTCTPTCPTFMWVQGIQIHVLMFAR